MDIRAERKTVQNAPKAKKSRRGLSLFLSLILAAEFCVAGFKYPGFLLQNKRKTGTYAQEILDSMGVTQEQLNAFLNDPIR